MANKAYPLGRAAFAEALVAWSTDNIKVALLTNGYTYSAAHQFVTDLGANIVARSGNLGTKTSVGGVLKSGIATWPVLTGAQCFYAVIYKDTGTDATSRLLYYIDTATNLPGTPNGIDVTCQFDPTTGDFQV